MSAEHDWLAVGNRRWCLTCDVFQSQRDKDAPWRPVSPKVCEQVYVP